MGRYYGRIIWTYDDYGSLVSFCTAISIATEVMREAAMICMAFTREEKRTSLTDLASLVPGLSFCSGKSQPLIRDQITPGLLESQRVFPFINGSWR